MRGASQEGRSEKNGCSVLALANYFCVSTVDERQMGEKMCKKKTLTELCKSL